MFNLTTLVASAAGFYLFLWALQHVTQDAREPRTVEDALPFISPVIGMMTRGSNFHRHLRNKYKLPIYTLRLPGSRLYVVNDTALIPIIQRHVRALSISPIMVRFFSHFMGVSKGALHIAGRDPLENHGFIHQITLETTKGLSPGPNLDDLNAKAVLNLSQSLDNLCANTRLSTVNMFEWVSKEIMLATTNSVYGPRNPFKNPDVQAAYSDYEAGLMIMMAGFFPRLLARKSLAARDTLVQAFKRYYAAKGLEEGSSVYARNRYEYPLKQGMDVQDVARMETGGAIGLLSNTMPATFWTIYHIFSDPIVLGDCRREVEKAVHENNGEKCLDLSYVKSSCPILVSTMQEAFRCHSIGVSARAVVEDHMLDGKYLLKKGSTVLIPSNVQHSLSPAWGDNVGEFYHKRFVRDTEFKKYNAVAFRAFGGGVNLCPGRHFATTEILAFASVILLRFDIKPLNGQWDTVGYREANAAFRLPSRDVRVELIPRDNKRWRVVLSEPGKPMELANNIPISSDEETGIYPLDHHEDAGSNLHTVSLGWVGALTVEVPHDPSVKMSVHAFKRN
ncbi:cytochrome P450 oxidoreductase [Xylaria bambusicola]|uniref:cytochrome P450 oxidoreductase n=1 Tax=Xylaria bambusicola TaxID=326684 RepID=UPI002007AB8D|nr:cytochrome P450 oxidoreductase [Xylaria bambusicola]KAI0521605.1 cytochrome P450 oxidoreductase [Xylaria bambusicola]